MQVTFGFLTQGSLSSGRLSIASCCTSSQKFSFVTNVSATHLVHRPRNSVLRQISQLLILYIIPEIQSCDKRPSKTLLSNCPTRPEVMLLRSKCSHALTQNTPRQRFPVKSREFWQCPGTTGNIRGRPEPFGNDRQHSGKSGNIQGSLAVSGNIGTVRQSP